MTTRTVAVKLSLQAADYLREAREVQRATREVRDEARRLEQAGSNMTRNGLLTMLAGVPGVASAAASGLGLLPAAALSGAAAISVLAVATNGVGDAMSAVADGDAQALSEAMRELTDEAEAFVREYQRVKPVLDQAGGAAQGAFFEELNGSLEQITEAYIPTLLRQLPRLAGQVGAVGSDFATWASTPQTVDQINRQFDLAVDLTRELSSWLRSGTAILLDLADAGSDFTRDTVGGLTKGVQALERWVGNAAATGELNQTFDNGGRILKRLGEIAADTGLLLADIVDNPALVDGAEALFDVLGMTLDVVHGLLTAFETLSPSVQSTIVQVAVFGGAALLAAGRVLALKAAIDAAKVSAVQNAVALRGIGSMLAGPWGVAVFAATVALGLFATKHEEAQGDIGGFIDTLNRETGAFTENTRAQAANELERLGVLKAANEVGLSSATVTDAILGQKGALDQVNGALAEAHRRYGSHMPEAFEVLEAGFRTTQGSLAAAQDAWKRTAAATDGTTSAIHRQVAGLQELAAELRAQADPVFALIKAQKDLAKAQADYDTAVKKHGENSKEAKAASLELAEASVGLGIAVANTATTFNGELTPEMYATLKAAKLTDEQIDDIREAFRNAAAAGSDFATTYTATANAKTKDAEAAIEDLIAKIAGLKNKTVTISAQVYFTPRGDLHVPGGTLIRRWGGITEHAQAGLLRDAAIYSPVAAGARYAFAEPATGGEAFIPKHGDHDRNMAILAEAARWNRASVVPWDSGGGGGGGNSYSTAYNIYPQQANFGVNELRAVQAARDAYDRVGRPR